MRGPIITSRIREAILADLSVQSPADVATRHGLTIGTVEKIARLYKVRTAA